MFGLRHGQHLLFKLELHLPAFSIQFEFCRKSSFGFLARESAQIFGYTICN